MPAVGEGSCTSEAGPEGYMLAAGGPFGIVEEGAAVDKKSVELRDLTTPFFESGRN